MGADRTRIRDALPEDWPAVADLLRQLGRPSALGTGREEELHEVYVEFLSRPDAMALVAERDGRVLGFCDLLFVPRLNFAGPQAWIPDLVVAEDDRGRGIGAALLAGAEALARDRGCWSVFLTSANWRTRSHAFTGERGGTRAGSTSARASRRSPGRPRRRGGARPCPRRRG